MFSESVSDAFHPGDFPISPRITRGRSAAAGLRTTSGLRVVRARRKIKSPPPEKMWSARRKVKSPPPKNHFPAPRGAGASKGDITSPREIISPFRSRVVRASKGDVATPSPPKRPKSPTGHPGALGKVPQSIPQWMFSESISDAFHPGDFPISPRITRGRSTAAPCQPARPRWVKSTQVTSAV